METEYISSQKEIYEHYRGQVMLLKHIADSIEGAEFELQREPAGEDTWEIKNISWNDKYIVTFPNLEYAPTSIEVYIASMLNGEWDNDGVLLSNEALSTDQWLEYMSINEEWYFEGEEHEDATLLEVVTLERERLKQTEQEVLEEKLIYGAYNSETNAARAIQRDLIDEPGAPIVKLYSQIEFLNNIEKIILEYETK